MIQDPNPGDDPVLCGFVHLDVKKTSSSAGRTNVQTDIKYIIKI